MESSKYGRSLTFPFSVIWGTLYWEFSNLLIKESIIIVFVVITLLLFATKELGVVYWVYGLAFLLFTPTLGTMESIYRQVIIAFPLYLMVGVSKKSEIVKLYYCILGLAIGIALFARWYIYGWLV
jgi:hypothetical protein